MHFTTPRREVGEKQPINAIVVNRTGAHKRAKHLLRAKRIPSPVGEKQPINAVVLNRTGGHKRAKHLLRAKRIPSPA